MLKDPDILPAKRHQYFNWQIKQNLVAYLPTSPTASVKKAGEATAAQLWLGDSAHSFPDWRAAGDKTLIVPLLPWLLGKIKVFFFEELFTIKPSAVIHKSKAKKKGPQCKML